MPFDWNEFYKLAGLLAEDLCLETLDSPSREAKLRSSISRAYYYSFCEVRNYLLAKRKIKIEDSRSHEKVINFLLNSNDKKEWKIGQYLFELREKRNDADYKNDLEEYVSDTKKSLNNAKRIKINLTQIRNAR